MGDNDVIMPTDAPKTYAYVLSRPYLSHQANNKVTGTVAR